MESFNNSSNNSSNTTPKITNNAILDIVNWLKVGDVVIIHDNNRKLVYHIDGLPYCRKIYINVSDYNSLLEDDEWPYYIESIGATKQNNDNIKCNAETFFFKFPA